MAGSFSTQEVFLRTSPIEESEVHAAVGKSVGDWQAVGDVS